MGKRKHSRKKKSSSRDSSPEIVGEYEVEAIIALTERRGYEEPRFWYLVQWYGYPGEETWEPQEHLIPECERLLQSLWCELHNVKADKYGIRRPSQEWIDSEVDYFRKTYVRAPVGPHSQRVIGYVEETGEIKEYA